jgi:hypothetical protein
MIDDYHCSFQHARVRDPFWDKGSELDALAATVLVLVAFDGLSVAHDWDQLGVAITSGLHL